MNAHACIICIAADCAAITEGQPADSRMAGAAATTLYHVKLYGIETTMASLCAADREVFERSMAKIKAAGGAPQ